MIRFKQVAPAALVALGSVAALAAVSKFSSVSDVHAATRLQGAGATFPQPLYERWVAEFQKKFPDVQIDYQAIGSGGGIKGITDQTVDFAGSDAPMSKAELEKVGGPDAIIEIPSCAGGVVPAYNLPGVKTELKFTGAILADIYMGKISKWNDPKIAAVNEGVVLPDTVITPAWRTDGSGTTFVFTNYLATQSESFKSTIGMGKEVKWPVGSGGKSNAGVAAVVQQTPGAIGYIEQNFANKNGIPFGAVQNKAGKFVKATPETVSAAGEGVVSKLTGTLLVAELWNQPGDNAYPISSFTYLIVYKDFHNLKDNRDKAQGLVDFMWWATHDGQKLATEMDYAPLAPAVTAKVDAALATLSFKGKKIEPRKPQ